MKVLQRRSDAAALARTANLLRLERLADRLTASGPLAVRTSTARAGGARVRYELDDDTALTLRLFWARRETVAALCSMRWEDRIGWVVALRTTAGERLVAFAWLAGLTPMASARDRPASPRRATRRST